RTLRALPGSVPGRVRRRDERLLEADRVAGGRMVRDPRHEHAAAAGAGRFTRLRPRVEPDGDEAATVRAARHAHRDYGLTDASVRKATSPCAARTEPVWLLRRMRVVEVLIGAPRRSCCQLPPGA